jgi:hypothetical protein
MFVYQVHSGLGDDLSGILTALTHRVWHGTQQRCRPEDLDPHLWPEVFHSFREIFKKRLSRHPWFEQLKPASTDSPCLLCGGGSAPPIPDSTQTFLLQIPYALDHFHKVVASYLARRIRKGRVGEGIQRRGLKNVLESSLRSGMEGCFLLGEICPNCSRHVVPCDVEASLDQSWEPVRRVLPEEVMNNRYREDM